MTRSVGCWDVLHPSRYEVRYRFVFRGGAPEPQAVYVPVGDDPVDEDERDPRKIIDALTGYYWSSSDVERIKAQLEEYAEADEHDELEYQVRATQWQMEQATKAHHCAKEAWEQYSIRGYCRLMLGTSP